MRLALGGLAAVWLAAAGSACVTLDRTETRPLVTAGILDGVAAAEPATATDAAPAETEAAEPVPLPAVPTPSTAAPDDWRAGLLQEKDGLYTRFYPIRNVPSGELQRLLDPWKSERGRLMDYATLNLLVLTDTPEGLERMDEVLKRLDRMSSQVLIKARVFEVRRDSDHEYGFSWHLSRKDGSSGSLRDVFSNLLAPSFQEHLNVTGNPDTFRGSLFKFQSEDRWALMEFAIHALVDRGQADILAEPSIVVHAGEEAEINTLTEVPIPKVTSLGINSVTITPEYRQVGIKLRVLPRVIGTDGVLLEVHPEVSSLAGSSTVGTITSPVFAKRDARTVVDVADGETLIIGGLQDTRMSSTTRGIPVLSSLPLVGHLFRSQKNQEVKTTIFIHLQITILHPGEQSKVRFSLPEER